MSTDPLPRPETSGPAAVPQGCELSPQAEAVLRWLQDQPANASPTFGGIAEAIGSTRVAAAAAIVELEAAGYVVPPRWVTG